MVQSKMLPSVLVVAALVPVIYICAPLMQLFHGVSWESLVGVLKNPEMISAGEVTLGSALLSTILAVVFGLPAAFILASTRFWGKRIVESVFLLPILLPPVVGGMGELLLYGPQTVLGAWFGGHHINLTNSMVGVVLAQTYITSPFLIFAAKAGFEEVPSDLIEYTATLGGGMWHVFWSVCVPLSRSSIVAGAALTFARSIGEFGATMMMAYHPYTLPVELWVQFSSGGLGTIVPIASLVSLIALCCAFVVSIQPWRLIRKASS